MTKVLTVVVAILVVVLATAESTSSNVSAASTGAASTGAASAKSARHLEYDVEGTLPKTIELAVGDVLDLTKIFPGSLKMAYAESDNDSVLSHKWVPKTLPNTPLPVKVVVGRFEATKSGKAKVTVTIEANNGSKTTRVIEVTVK